MDTNGPLKFLHSLWDGKPDDAWMLVWTLRDKKSAWFQSIDLAAEYVQQATSDVYIGAGLSPAAFGPNERCKSDEILGIAGLWADLDLASPAHPGKNLPNSVTEALTLLPHWLKPTYIVNTGNGVHIWFLFREPWIFANDQERVQAANLELRFQTMIAQRAQERG